MTLSSNGHTPETAKKQNNKALYIIIGVLVVGIVGILLFFLFQNLTAGDDNTVTTTDTDASDGTVINPPQQMPDFTLTNQNGEEMSLSDLRGNLVLMAFGYTHCPDICPTTLNEFKQIQKTLGDNIDDVTFVFVSVDGARDTPAALTSYFKVRGLDEHFIGLTGTESELRTIGVDYGLYFDLHEPDENGFYEVDHTAGYYLLDQQGRWVMRYRYQIDRDIITEDLQEFLDS